MFDNLSKVIIKTIEIKFVHSIILILETILIIEELLKFLKIIIVYLLLLLLVKLDLGCSFIDLIYFDIFQVNIMISMVLDT